VWSFARQEKYVAEETDEDKKFVRLLFSIDSFLPANGEAYVDARKNDAK